MPIALTDDQRALGEVARSFAGSEELLRANRALFEAGGTELPGYWPNAAELGWPGLPVGEEFGGSGATVLELAVVADEFGGAAAPGPFLPAVIGAAVLDAAGTDELRTELLPDLVAGRTIAAFAPAPAVSADAGTVTGDVLVPGGVWAQHVLLGVGADLFVVATGAAGVQVSAPDGALDPALGVARVRLDGASAKQLSGAADHALAIARAVVAAEAAGGARATLQMALAYSKVREQFGRPIGSFQAIKHHLANMLVAAERAAAVAWDAARAAARTDGQAELAGAVAASVALRCYVENAQQNIQIHGGIGFTWEHDAHLFLRRALTLSAVFGAGADEQVHRSVAGGVRRAANVELPPEAEQFRGPAAEVAARVRAAGPDKRRGVLVDSGYLVPHWPAPFGRGAGPIEQLVVEQEFAGIDVPELGIGGWVLLTLVQQARPAQVERWIPPSLRGEHTWCQLFSEPGAGSDAAAVQTKAVRVEGGWRISGQKVWTSGAQNCDRGLATVRTNPDVPKHRGITTVVIDLTAEGVTVRPLREITGGARFNEVFFDDVFVPDDDVVGEVDDGWTVARATLGNERVSIGGRLMGTRATDLLDVIDDGDPAQRAELGRLLADEQALQMLNLRRVERAVAGGDPGPEGNVTKLITAEWMQAVTEFALRVLGPAGVDGSHPELAWWYLFDRSMTIAGGTSEVSRNVIAERILGLPREAIAN